MTQKSQREKILSLLRFLGKQGATNMDLNKICYRFSARIFELRKAGYDIETVRDSEQVYRFILRREPLPLFRRTA